MILINTVVFIYLKIGTSRCVSAQQSNYSVKQIGINHNLISANPSGLIQAGQQQQQINKTPVKRDTSLGIFCCIILILEKLIAIQINHDL